MSTVSKVLMMASAEEVPPSSTTRSFNVIGEDFAPAMCWDSPSRGARTFSYSVFVQKWARDGSDLGYREVKVNGKTLAAEAYEGVAGFWVVRSWADLIADAGLTDFIGSLGYGNGLGRVALAVWVSGKSTFSYGDDSTGGGTFSVYYFPALAGARLYTVGDGTSALLADVGGWNVQLPSVRLMRGGTAAAGLASQVDGGQAIIYGPTSAFGVYGTGEEAELVLALATPCGGSAELAVSALASDSGLDEPSAKPADDPGAGIAEGRDADGCAVIDIAQTAGAESWTVKVAGSDWAIDTVSVDTPGRVLLPAAPRGAFTLVVTASGGFSFEGGKVTAASSSIEVAVPAWEVDALQLVPASGAIVTALYNIEYSRDVALDSESVRFAGRERPSVFFGEGGTGEWSVSWSIPPGDAQQAALDVLEAALGQVCTLLAPDGERRRVALESPSVSKAAGGIASVSATLTECA